MEHSNKDALNYKKMSVSFEDVEKAYNGFLENFHIDNNPTFYEFYIENIEKEDNYFDEYKSNMLLNKNDIFNGLSVLQKYFNETLEVLKDESRFWGSIESVILCINDILNAKYVDKYRISNILSIEKDLHSEKQDYNEIVDCCIDIVEAWEKIRVKICKIIYATNYSLSKIQTIITQIENVLFLEIEYYRKIFDVLERK